MRRPYCLQPSMRRPYCLHTRRCVLLQLLQLTMLVLLRVGTGDFCAVRCAGQFDARDQAHTP